MSYSSLEIFETFAESASPPSWLRPDWRGLLVINPHSLRAAARERGRRYQRTRKGNATRRAWRVAHPGSVRTTKLRWRTRNREYLRETDRIWKQEHRQRSKAYKCGACGQPGHNSRRHA